MFILQRNVTDLMRNYLEELQSYECRFEEFITWTSVFLKNIYIVIACVKQILMLIMPCTYILSEH